MAPEGPLGAQSAQRAAQGAPGEHRLQTLARKKINGQRLGGLLGRKVGRFHASGGSPGGRRRVPGRLREAILEAFLQQGLAARKKLYNLDNFQHFWQFCLDVFCFDFFVFLAAPARERT